MRIKKLAVIGATNNLGREVIYALHGRQFPAEEIVALDTGNVVGDQVAFGLHRRIIVQDLKRYNFSDTDMALFVSTDSIAEVYGDKAASLGCMIVDTSSYYRLQKNIPLIVADVNSNKIPASGKIFSTPSVPSIQATTALKLMHDLYSIKRIVMSTYQSVSEDGKAAMDELFEHTKRVYENQFAKPIHFKKPIPFNLIPQIGVPRDDGDYEEEWRIGEEIRKILHNDIKTSITCVKVPVFACCSLSINVEFNKPVNFKKVGTCCLIQDNLELLDDPSDYTYATPKDCMGSDEIYVSRLRLDKSVESGLSMWVVTDNVKRQALNLVQVAEILSKTR